MEENKISLCSPHSPVRAPSPRKVGCSWDLFQKIADTSAISPSFKFLLVLSQRSSREENPHFVWTLLTRSKGQTQLPLLNPPWKTPKKQQVLTPTSSACEQLKKKTLKLRRTEAIWNNLSNHQLYLLRQERLQLLNFCLQSCVLLLENLEGNLNIISVQNRKLQLQHFHFGHEVTK